MLVARGTIEHRQAILKIGFQSFVPETYEVSPTQPHIELPVQEYRALIDTGAQRTCLTRKTIAIESLVDHGKKPIQNVNDSHLHRLYWAHLGFFAERFSDNGEHLGHTYFSLPEPVEVIDIANNNGFDAIIGMDILRHYELRFEGSGAFHIKLD
jgi:hypothetical protein